MKDEDLESMREQFSESRKRMQSGDLVKLFLQSEHAIADHMPTLNKSGTIQFKVQGLMAITDPARESIHFSNGTTLSVENFKSICRGFTNELDRANWETPVFGDWLRVHYGNDWFTLKNALGWGVSCSRYGEARRVSLCAPNGRHMCEWTFSDHAAFENEDLEIQELAKQAQKNLELLKEESNE